MISDTGAEVFKTSYSRSLASFPVGLEIVGCIRLKNRSTWAANECKSKEDIETFCIVSLTTDGLEVVPSFQDAVMGTAIPWLNIREINTVLPSVKVS